MKLLWFTLPAMYQAKYLFVISRDLLLFGFCLVSSGNILSNVFKKHKSHNVPGNVETAKVILTNERYHALLNETDLDTDTPFHVACREGQEQVVAALVELGEELIDWNAQSMYKHSGFSVACRNNCLPVVNLLLELLKGKLDGFNFNIGFEGACRKGHLPVVNRLLELPERRLEKGTINTGFSLACRNGHLLVVNRLLELPEGKLEVIKLNTSFKGACYFGHLPVVNRLLELADSRNIDVEKGLREAERGQKPGVVDAIKQNMTHKEHQIDPLQ